MSYSQQYLEETVAIIKQLDIQQIDKVVDMLVSVRSAGGRLFLIGVGGSAANCSHAVNDFRKLCGIESYTPTDNVSELTARTNDDGWETVFSNWLRVSKLHSHDLVFVLSVGGGNLKKNISPNLVRALQYAKEVGARVAGIVGRDGGHTASVADACIIVPTVNAQSVTPHAEAFQGVLWHLMVSHPKLQQAPMKWESARV
jgi:D-sedoheptulose 7-phosphate isomerase